jgi:hypothetical protein
MDREESANGRESAGAHAPRARLEREQTPGPSECVYYSNNGEKFSERSAALLVEADNKGMRIFFGFTHANSRVSAIYL